ncbi:MAG: diguanylate cyclase [Candidatus Sedimenticola endophacoides]
MHFGVESAHYFRLGTLARVGTHLERLHYQRRLQAGNEELNRRGELLSAIERLQAAFIGEVDPLDLYGAMLSALQSLSGSAEGFLAEVHHTPEGKPYLRIYAISAPGRFFHANLGVGMAQRDLDNLCGAAVHAAEAVICNDPAGDPRWDGAVPAGGGPFLGMPIHCGERLVGLAGLSGREGGYDAELLAYLRPLVRTCGQLIDARQQREARSAAEQELNRLARVDGLTNIPNRRSQDEFLDNEWQRLLRNGGVLSLIMIDIDHFKRYNDHYGHISGDACLIELAWIRKEKVQRPSDLVARYGGEEFFCVLFGTLLEGALEVARAIARELRQIARVHADSPVDPLVTVSMGVVSGRPRDGGDSRALLSAADECLYHAKHGGRNRIISRDLEAGG